jgi:hypothetical protein
MKVRGAGHAPGCPALRYALRTNAHHRLHRDPQHPAEEQACYCDPQRFHRWNAEAVYFVQVDTSVQFYKWFNELTDRGLIPRYPGYEQGTKLPPPGQVMGPCHAATCQLLHAVWFLTVQHDVSMRQAFFHTMCVRHRRSLQDRRR